MNYDKDACRVNSVKNMSTVKLYYMTDYIYRFCAYFVNADLYIYAIALFANIILFP